MFGLLAQLLAFFYDLVANYALATALVTVAVMLAFAPLTLKGTRSMLAMQRLQPEVKRLQAEHKHDRQAMNEALMAFYREHKINPVSGCLPTLVQLPVFFVMFQVIQGLVKLPPKYVSEDSALYDALIRAEGAMESFGIDFSQRPLDGGSSSIPLYFLVALVVLTGYWQIRQMQARSKAAQQAINPQMQMMTKVMPIFSGLASATLPGLLSVYFLTSNLFRIVQQTLMYRFDPALASEVRREITEIESKTVERERAHRDERRSTPKPTSGGRPGSSNRNSGGGRTTPNGSRPGGSRSSKKKSKRRKR